MNTKFQWDSISKSSNFIQHSFLEKYQGYSENNFTFDKEDCLLYSKIFKETDTEIELIDHYVSIKKLNSRDISDKMDQEVDPARAIVWISNVLNYCQYSPDSQLSLLEEDVIHFHDFLSRLKNNTPLYLCLNMKDLLGNFLKKYPIQKYLKKSSFPNQTHWEGKDGFWNGYPTEEYWPDFFEPLNVDSVLQDISNLYTRKVRKYQRVFVHSTSFVSLKDSKEVYDCIVKNLSGSNVSCECKSKNSLNEIKTPILIEDYF
jgi:hypothetical protein